MISGLSPDDSSPRHLRFPEVWCHQITFYFALLCLEKIAQLIWSVGKKKKKPFEQKAEIYS